MVVKSEDKFDQTFGLTSLQQELFLDSSRVLTRPEKIEHYDQLKEKYEEMLGMYNNYERKANYLERQVQEMEKLKKMKTMPKMITTAVKVTPKIVKKKTFKGQDNSLKSYEAIENDPSLPPGWKSSWRLNDGFSKGTRSQVFWASNGRFLSSRVTALNYMLSGQVDVTDEGVRIMRKALMEEGWEENTSLPPGWLCKDDPKVYKKFLTKEYVYLKNAKSAITHILLHCSNKELAAFLDVFCLKTDRVVDWVDSSDIPHAWRVANTVSGNALLVSPEGEIITTFTKAVQEIERANDVTHEQKTKFLLVISLNGSSKGNKIKVQPREIPIKSNVALVKTEPSEEEISVPEKTLLFPGGNIQVTRIKIEKDPETTPPKTPVTKPQPLPKKPPGPPVPIPGPQTNTKTSEPQTSTKTSDKSGGWELDESAPSGWKSCMKFGKKFKDPNGRFYVSRMDALRNMVKDNSISKEDVEKMREGLLLDGWRDQGNLPSGWMVRQKMVPRKEGERDNYSPKLVTSFLTDTYEMLTKAEAVKYLENNNSSLEEVESFKEFYKVFLPALNEKNRRPQFRRQPLSTKKLPKGWMCSTFPNENIGTMKTYTSPKGQKFSSIGHVLRHLLATDSEGSELKAILDYIPEEGWFVTDLLPPGWYVRQKKSEKGFYFLNPKFEKLSTMKALQVHLKENGYGEAAVKKFMDSYTTIQGEPENADTYAARRAKERQRNHNRTLQAAKERSEQFSVKSEPMEESEEPANEYSEEQNETETNDNMGDHGELDWTDHKMLPPGWKTAVTEISFGQLKGTKFRRFMSSSGEFFGNIAEALRLLATHNDQAGVEVLKTGLQEDGWKMPEYLPGNWFSKKIPFRDLTYLSPTFETFTSDDGVLAYLKGNNATEEDLEAFRKKSKKPSKSLNTKREDITEASVQALLPSVTIKKISEKIPENKVDKVLDKNSTQTPSETDNLWVSDQSIPAGWRLSHKETEEGVKTTLFQTREGRVMNSRTQAIKYMTTETEIYTKQDIDRMKEGLAQDGWSLAHSLPAGWMRKTTTSQESGEVRTIFMTPNYETLKSVKNVISYMKLKRYSVDVIDRFRKEPLKPEDDSKTLSPKRGLDEEAKPASPPPPAKVAKTVVQPQVRSRNSGPDWQEGDSTLPQGWKKRFNSGLGVDQILSPHGHVFRDRAEGLKYIMENNRVYSEQDRKEMEDRLGCEGWETEPLLPQGWKLRKVDGSVQFLTEVSSKIKIVKSARANIRKNHGEEELKNFSILVAKLKPLLKETDEKIKPPTPQPAVNKVSIKTEPKEAEEEPKDPLDITDTQKKNEPVRIKQEKIDDADKTSPTTALPEKKDAPRATPSVTVKKETEKKSSQTAPPVTVKKETEKKSSQAVPPVTVKKETEKKSSEAILPVTVKTEPGLEEESDGPLPPRWRLEEDRNGDEVIVNPDGRKFSSRVLAVEWMIKTKQEPKSIYNMWSSLDTEGWVLGDQRVPAGWRVKHHPGICDYKYLTREMKVLSSSEQARQIIKESADYDEENKKNFEEWLKELEKTQPTISWKKDGSLPGSWFLSTNLDHEVIMDEKGSLFEGRKEAIDHMIKEKYPPTDIFKLWNTLHLEGWVTDDDSLPTGWKRKHMKAKDKFFFLSPMMEVVKTTKALLDIVKGGKEYTEEEVEKVRVWVQRERVNSL